MATFLCCISSSTIDFWNSYPSYLFFWKKAFVNQTYNKKLVSRIYKELLQFNKKTNIPVKKWVKDLNRHLTKTGIGIINIHIKRWSASLAIRGIQIKTTMRCHHITTETAILKKNVTIRSVSKDKEKLEPLHMQVGM